MRRLVLAALAIPTMIGITGCDQKADGACEDHACHAELRGGQTFSIDELKFSVTQVGSHSVKISFRNASLSVHEGADIKLGRYRLHLDKVVNGTARLDVEPADKSSKDK